MVTPLGLDGAVRTLTGSGLNESKAGLELRAADPPELGQCPGRGRQTPARRLRAGHERRTAGRRGIRTSTTAADRGGPIARHYRDRNGDGGIERRRASQRRSGGALAGIWMAANGRVASENSASAPNQPAGDPAGLTVAKTTLTRSVSEAGHGSSLTLRASVIIPAGHPIDQGIRFHNCESGHESLHFQYPW